MSESDRLEAGEFHVGAQLIRDFFEDLLGKVASRHSFSELDKLDDISGSWDTT